MAFSPISFDQIRSDFYRYMTLDVSTYLQSIQGVCELKLDERYGCEALAILHWEQLQAIQLPEEVKNFYLSTNGFELTWKFSIAEQSNPLGIMHINILGELCPINDPWKTDKPFDKYDKSLIRLFVLDSHFSQGIVVLMLIKGSPSSSTVHFLTSQGNLIQIADSFTCYLRLMLLYLGLPDWPLVHLDMEISYWNKQVYTHFAPYLLTVRSNKDGSDDQERSHLINTRFPVNVLDVGIFKATKTPR